MNDTHPKIEAVHLEMLRALTSEARLKLALRFSRNIIDLSRKQFVNRHGELGLQRWLEAHYGQKLARGALGSQYRE
ncbi:MAG: hypothetical protein RLZZ156_804 [Deinococcota bacterium]|jgi:hypothetical protein